MAEVTVLRTTPNKEFQLTKNATKQDMIRKDQIFIYKISVI